jgi:aspartate-alanine antiporter
MMGTAGDALKRLGGTPAQEALFSSQMAVGFAITYVFGTIGVIVFVRSVAPRLLGVDVKAAARELETELSEGGKVSRPGFITPYVPVVSRAFAVTPEKAANSTIGQLRDKLGRATIERVVRGDEVIAHGPDLVLQAGDVIGVAGRMRAVVTAGEMLGDEIESQEALSFPVKQVSVVVTEKGIAGRTLRQARDSFSEEDREGVYLTGIERQGLALPILLRTQLRRGDVVKLVGRPADVDRAAAAIGFADPGSGRSDLAYHTLAIVAGILLGLITVVVGGIPVTLGVGGGVLVSGLAFGWLHTRYPVFGDLPGPAQWILSEFGLSAFAAVIGLSAGPKAIAAIQEQGIALLLAGVVVTMAPLLVAIYFGRFVLKLHPVILLGALCGGQTVAAALNAVNEETESMTPVLGFTVTYAISNVLLAVWGPVIVALA